MDLRWHGVLLAIALYFTLAWVMLFLCGEQQLTESPFDFLYWIVVTGSTVGYGDMSPTTAVGKLVTAFFVIPFGLGIFTLAVARVIAFAVYQWRKGLLGMKQLDYTDHILIVGWNENRTLQLIRHLLREVEFHSETTQIALCVKADIENPMRDEIGFVKVESFSSDVDMHRAGVHTAKSIIIDNPDDDVSMTTALYCANENPDAHTICHFRDPSLGELLKKHCPNVECMPSVSVEMIAKSTMDPGSSALHHQLLDGGTGMTQYSHKFQSANPTSVEAMFIWLKKEHDAILIGLSADGPESMKLNPPLSAQVESGTTIYYIADERINAIDWESVHAA